MKTGIFSRKQVQMGSLVVAVLVMQIAFVSVGAFSTKYALAQEAGDTNTNTNTDSNTNTNSDPTPPDANTNTNTSSDANSNTNTSGDTNSNTNSSDTNSNTNTNSNSDTNSNTNSDSTPPPAATPELTTDQADYHPGETATIFGRFFQAVQNIVLKIFGGSQDNGDYTETNANVTTDDQGAFSFLYTLEDYFRPLYTVVAYSADTMQELAQTTFTDSLTTLSATLNGSSSVTVAPGASITAVVTGQTTGGDAWKGTDWLISTTAPGTMACVNTNDHTTNGTFAEAFTITAPSIAGTYNVYFRTNKQDGCSGGSNRGSLLTMSNVVIVSSVVSQTITVTTHAPANAVYNSTFPVAATASSGLPVAITTTDGCSGSGSGSATITMTSGTTACVVHYNQAGNGSFSAAPEITETTTATPKALTAALTGTVSKIYDSSTAATLAAGNYSLPGVVSGDTVILNNPVSGTYDTKNVGTSKIVSVTGLAISGSSASNYSLTSTAASGPVGTITVHSLTLTALTNTKIYDGTTTAAVVPSTTGLQGSDTVSSLTESYDNANAGTGKTLSVNAGYVVNDGNSGNNYSVSTQTNTTGVINPADQTINFGTLSSKTYGDSDVDVSATASSNLVVTFTASGNCSMFDADTVHITGAGSCTVTAHQTGNANYNAASNVLQTFAIDKATATISITAYHVDYDANSHTATGSATGVGGVDLSAGLDLTGTTHTNAGTYNGDTWTFTGGTNYNNDNGTVDDSIAKIDATITVNGYTGVYDAASHGATGSATGIASADLNSLLHLGDTFTDYPGGTANWIFDGDTNYNSDSGSVDITINKADADTTVTAYHVDYDGATHTAAGTATGVAGTDLSASLDLTGTTHTNAGIYSGDGWTFAGGTNYNDANGTVDDSIDKIDATIVVNGYSGVYDSTAHGATGSATGVNSTDLSASLNLGATFTDVPGGLAHWTFSGGTNYNDDSGDVAIDISKADADVTVIGYAGIYDAAAHGATGSAIGVGGVDLSASLDFDTSYTDVPGGNAHWTFDGGTNYIDENGDVAIDISKADAEIFVTSYDVSYDGTQHTATGSATGIGGVDLSAGLDLSATSHTNAGDYTADEWTFDGGTNYNNENGAVHDIISKINATITVSGYTGIYDAAAHGATGTAKGILDEALAGLDLGASYTDVPGGTAHWIFTDVTGNYNDDAGDVAIDISKADAEILITAYHVDYDANSHTATGSATGVGGTDLSANLDLSGTTHTNAGSYIGDAWTFNGGVNYNNANGTVDDLINKIDATIIVSGYSDIYDAVAHGATGTATGVNSADLSSSLDLGATFTDVPGGLAHWTFDGGTNYNNANGDVAIDIAKADAQITVTPYSIVYDAAAHTATGSAKGVLDEDLVGLNLTGTTHTNAGSYPVDAWTFIDLTGNYNDDNGTVADNIDKADATISVLGYTGIYDANAHGASGSATGVLDEALSGLDLGETFTNVPGGTANWTFTDVTGNYNDASGNVAIVINSLNLTISAENKSKQYSDPLPTFTVTYSGFIPGEGPANLGGVLTCSSTATATSGPGTYPITCSGSTSGNYVIHYAPGTLTVTQEDARNTFTGSNFASTSSVSSGSATVTLAATIQDITAVIGDPAFDANAGDIRKATVTFVNRDAGNATLCSASVGLVNPADLKTGTATCNWSANIGSADSTQYTVGIVVTNHYTRNDSTENTVVTVSKPIASSFITGGGYLVLANSAGIKAGTPGTKANYGFNVKYNKSGTNLQGNINTIIRRLENDNIMHTYQIKGNAMTSLSVNPTNCPQATASNPCKAVFNGKSNITDITNPAAPVALEGNGTLQVTMTDKGQPGANDMIGITLWNKNGGLWFSSNWNNTATTEQLLNGGNLVVH